MYVSSIFVDRFGRRADLRITHLSNGLNVVCGPLGSGKTTLVEFLRAMWNGFDSRLREQYLPSDSRGFGGVISVQTAHGRQTISRYDDGSPEGRLTVERKDGAVIGRRHIHDLIGDVSARLLEHAFLVNFQHSTRLDELLAAATARGYELAGNPESSDQLRAVERLLTEKRQSLERLSPVSDSSKTLKNRRRKRAQNIDSAAGSTHSDSDELIQHRQRLQGTVAELQQRETAVSAELATCDRTWNELDAQRQHKEAHPAATGQSAQDLSARLGTIDAQLARWNRTLRDVVTRKQRAAERSDNRQQAVAVAAENATPRRHLIALKRRIQESQQSLEQISSQKCDCVCQDLRTAFVDVLHSMQDDVDQLSNDLNYWQSYHLYRQAAGERDQLARCELELRQTIQSLVERRQAMLCRIVDAKSATSCHPGSESQGQGSEHSLPVPQSDAVAASLRDTATCPADVAVGDDSNKKDELAALNAELVRVDESRHKNRRELLEIACQLANARSELQKLEDSPARSDATMQVESNAVMELEPSVRDAEIREDLLREIDRLEADSRRLREKVSSGNFVREASQYLRRLSSNKWCEIHVASPEQVLIEGAHGRRLPYDDLDAGGRDQVYLAFCLAVVAACDRDGVCIPLVLNAAFTHYPSKDVRDALELLRDFARDRQVLCLTRYEHVVGLARMLNTPVHQLSSLEAAETRAAATVVFSESRRVLAQSEQTLPLGATRTSSARLDAEEFPVEVSGRVRQQNTAASQQLAPTHSAAVVPPVTVSVAAPTTMPKPSAVEYHLSECDPIEQAPSIDQTNANRLRRIGILRVGDLWRVSAEEITADLRQFGITSEMVQAWQSQVRLMCQVRGLLSFDARILVACGITDPKQLLGMNSTALRNRVREFSATADGQAILLSGTESELSRVTDWIQVPRNLVHGARHARARNAA